MVCSFIGSGAAEPVKAPRGKPIRPAPAFPELVSTQNIVRLPGGVLITNIPGEFLPKTTNTVRVPPAAARKFELSGYTATSFTVLSRFFPTNTTEGWEKVRAQIPGDVLALDGKKVAVAGFTLPLAVTDGRTKEFILMRTQAACCFGMVPRVNELIMVKMPSGMKPELDVPVVVGGTFSIKWIGESNDLTAIYEMIADRAEAAR